MKSPANMLRSCKVRISAISNRSQVASKCTAPLSTIRDDRSTDREVEEEIIFEEIDTPETEEKGGGKKRRQFFQRLRQIATPKRLAGVSELEEDENTYTEDDTISDVEEKDENHFVTSFDWVETGMNDSAVATEKDSVQTNQEEVVDNQVKKRACFRAEDIWTACKVGDEDSVKNTIANDPTLVHLAESGRTPLYNACLCGHDRIVKILLEAGAQDPDKTAYIAALTGPCRELLREHESNQKAQLQLQEEIAKRLVDDREKEETAAILRDLTNTPLGAQGTIFLDNETYADIDSVAGAETGSEAEAEANHKKGTGDTEVDTPNNIGSGEASMDVANDNNGSGDDCDATDSSDRCDSDVDAANKSNPGAADVEAVEGSFYTLYSVFVPFQSHLVRNKDEGFETILEPVIKSGEEGSDMSASDVSFDPRMLNDAMQFIRFFTEQDGISGGPGGSNPASDGNISSKLDHLNAKHSAPRAQTSSLLAKYAYDTDCTGSLSTDGQTFASEGDSFFVEDLFDGELPLMEVVNQIEFTFCALLFPAAQA